MAGRVPNLGQDLWREVEVEEDTTGALLHELLVRHQSFNPHMSLPCVHSIRSVMQKYLEERDELTFDKIFNQKIGKSTFLL